MNPEPDQAASPPRRLTRRRAAALAIGAAALGAGAWLAQRQRQTAEPAPGFWSLAFDAPDGGRLALDGFRGRPLILNFWATWCPPCVREMPLLASSHAQLQRGGIALVGLAVDGMSPVREFLARQPAPYPIGLAGFAGTALSKQLGNTGGGLPFTLALGRDGQVVQRKIGELHAGDLAAWIDQLQS